MTRSNRGQLEALTRSTGGQLGEVTRPTSGQLGAVTRPTDGYQSVSGLLMRVRYTVPTVVLGRGWFTDACSIPRAHGGSVRWRETPKLEA